MRLNNNEFYISKESCGECITISKKALEEWRNHYGMVAEDHKDDAFRFGLYIGKRDVIVDLLKHFEED